LSVFADFSSTAIPGLTTVKGARYRRDDMKTSSDPNTGKPAPVAWYADPQPILFDQIEVGQGALFTRDELPEPVEEAEQL